MVDKEKVLVGLKSCADSTGALCRTCPYDFIHNENCMGDMAQDALELLKEQEPVKPVVNVDEWVCGCCGTWLERQRMIHPGAILHDLCDYCPHCGKKIDWEAVKQND
jgi:hypothetical protein